MKPDSNAAFDFQQAVFTYAISSDPIRQYPNHQPISGGCLTVSFTDKTDVYTYSANGREAAVIGICVDALGELSPPDVPRYLTALEKADILSVCQEIRRFAGRFILYYSNQSGEYLIPDAYGLLEINYGRMGKDFCAASIAKTVGDYFGLPISKVSSAIKEGGDFSQPLPFQTTMYDQVKALLSNHYLDLKDLKMKRVPINVHSVKTAKELDLCVERTIGLVTNILRAYRERFAIACPLTAGSDSRVVLSFLKREDPTLSCYTFYHDGFQDDTPDIAIPRQISKDLSLSYEVIRDETPSGDYFRGAISCLGDYCSDNTLSLAFTFSSHFPDKILIHSDILDQIGKSSLGKNIPSFLATPGFFNCKLHNFSRLTKAEMKKMWKDMKQTEAYNDGFDLYCIEEDGARWVAQGLTAYSVCGVTALNLFNCGMILDLWMGVPRKLRMRYAIHKGILERLEPRLLQYPVNPGLKYDSLKKSSFLFWLGSHVQYWLHMIQRGKSR